MQLRKKYIRFDDAEKLLRKVAQICKCSKFDIIASVGRGGLVPARILSEMLDVKSICMLDISLYDEYVAKTLKTDISTVAKRYYKKIFKGKRVLVVDDCITTGRSIEYAKKYIRECGPTSVNAAVMFFSQHCQLHQDAIYAKKYNAESTWLVFPWEELLAEKKG